MGVLEAKCAFMLLHQVYEVLVNSSVFCKLRVEGQPHQLPLPHPDHMVFKLRYNFNVASNLLYSGRPYEDGSKAFSPNAGI